MQLFSCNTRPLRCSVGQFEDTKTSTGSALECNPNVIYSIIAPLAAVTTLAIVGALFVSVEAEAKMKAL